MLHANYRLGFQTAKVQLTITFLSIQRCIGRIRTLCRTFRFMLQFNSYYLVQLVFLALSYLPKGKEILQVEHVGTCSAMNFVV